MKNILKFSAILLVSIMLCLASITTPVFANNNGHNDSPVDRLLVTFHPGMKFSDLESIHKQMGASIEAIIPGINVHVVTVPAGKGLSKMHSYRQQQKVRSVEPDFVAQVIDTPNDPYFSIQWGMSNVQAPEAWGITTGNDDIIIAILDTGVDYDHPDLSGKVVINVNFTSSPTADANGHSHGTHVAGIAAADTNNAIGIAGLGYNSSIMNVKVLGDSGYGFYSWIASGIIWATDNGADIINLSLGATAYSSTLQFAVDYAWQHGVVVVAAAGNNGSSTPFYPAYFENCIAVAATDSNDSLYSWSNHGTWVDVSAPGSAYSTIPNNSYGYKAGTSMSSPHVAGLAGLVFCVVSDNNGNGRINDEVRYRIENSCDDVPIDVAYGRINAYQAVRDFSPTTAEIAGTVIDAGTGMVINGITVSNGTVTDITDTSGHYCLPELAPGTHTLTASGDGYQSSTQETTVQAGDAATVNFKLISTNNQPVASDDSTTTNEDSPVTIDVLSNDYDIDGDSLQIVNLTQPSGGSAVINADQTITYIPNPDFNGGDSFTYIANDGIANSNVASVIVTVNPVNDAPIAYDQSVTTGENTPVTIILDADDVDGDLLTYDIISGPTGGNLSGTPPILEYVPNPGFVGSDSFTFRVDDGITESNLTTVSIMVESTASTMTIQDCNVELVSRWHGWYYYARATVSIVDNLGNPVYGATVTGEWDGATSGIISGITNEPGQVIFTSRIVWKPPSGIAFTFTVTDVSHPELQWDNISQSDSAIVIKGK